MRRATSRKIGKERFAADKARSLSQAWGQFLVAEVLFNSDEVRVTMDIVVMPSERGQVPPRNEATFFPLSFPELWRAIGSWFVFNCSVTNHLTLKHNYL